VRTQEVSEEHAGAAGQVLAALWALVRVPIAVILLVLEPLVRITLVGFALLLGLALMVFKLGAPAGFTMPFWPLLTASVGCIALFWIYDVVLRLFSR
jgi:hypothetical protein